LIQFHSAGGACCQLVAASSRSGLEGRQQSQLLLWQTAAAAGGCGLSCELAEHVLPGGWLSAQPKLNVDKQT